MKAYHNKKAAFKGIQRFKRLWGEPGQIFNIENQTTLSGAGTGAYIVQVFNARGNFQTLI